MKGNPFQVVHWPEGVTLQICSNRTSGAPFRSPVCVSVSVLHSASTQEEVDGVQAGLKGKGARASGDSARRLTVAAHKWMGTNWAASTSVSFPEALTFWCLTYHRVRVRSNPNPLCSGESSWLPVQHVVRSEGLVLRYLSSLILT